jgi:predicted acetyltransferase
MDQIRRLKAEELDESFALSEFAFQYELSPEDRAERMGQVNLNQLWGYFMDGKLASKLTILDFQTWINGKSFAMGGIAGVATWPEYRRNGMVGKLLRHALQVMKEQGQTVSFLHPFAFAFYRKYGWETYIEYKKYEIETAKLSGVFAAGPGTVKRVPLDWKLLQPVYEAYAAQYNGMLRRDEFWWTQRYFKFKKGTAAVYYNAEGEARGYVFYQVKDYQCKIHELVHLDQESRSALWKFIADHDSMMEKVLVNAPSDDDLPFLLANPRIKHEVVPYFMARIVDVAAFLAQYPFAAAAGGEEERFALQVADGQAEWNDGMFELVIDADGRASVTKKDVPGDPAETNVLACDIQTLSTLLMGYRSASALHRIGRFQGSAAEAARLEKRIPQRTTYLADFF